MTPLIDVVFILLVFFMLASSFLDWRKIEVAVPEPGRTGASATGAMLVEIRADGLRLSGQSLGRDEIMSRLATRLRAQPDQRVLVKAAPGIALQETIALLDGLTAAGVTELSLIRDQPR